MPKLPFEMLLGRQPWCVGELLRCVAVRYANSLPNMYQDTSYHSVTQHFANSTVQVCASTNLATSVVNTRFDAIVYWMAATSKNVNPERATGQATTADATSQ